MGDSSISGKRLKEIASLYYNPRLNNYTTQDKFYYWERSSYYFDRYLKWMEKKPRNKIDISDYLHAGVAYQRAAFWSDDAHVRLDKLLRACTWFSNIESVEALGLLKVVDLIAAYEQMSFYHFNTELKNEYKSMADNLKRTFKIGSVYQVGDAVFILDQDEINRLGEAPVSVRFIEEEGADDSVPLVKATAKKKKKKKNIRGSYSFRSDALESNASVKDFEAGITAVADVSLDHRVSLKTDTLESKSIIENIETDVEPDVNKSGAPVEAPDITEEKYSEENPVYEAGLEKRFQAKISRKKKSHLEKSRILKEKEQFTSVAISQNSECMLDPLSVAQIKKVYQKQEDIDAAFDLLDEIISVRHGQDSRSLEPLLTKLKEHFSFEQQGKSSILGINTPVFHIHDIHRAGKDKSWKPGMITRLRNVGRNIVTIFETLGIRRSER